MVQKLFPAACWDLVERSYPTAASLGVAVCVPRGGCADVGAVTCVLVAEGGGTCGGRGTGWLCLVPASAEPASPGGCHCLMKMDLELLGDGVEKDGKKPSEMEKRTCSPSVLFPFPMGLRCASRRAESDDDEGFSVGLCPRLGTPKP